MRQSFVITTFVLLTGFMLCDNAVGREQSVAVVSVEVRNATPDGKDVVGDKVSLRIFHENHEVKSLDGEVGADGKAVFENVPVGAGFTAKAQVKHSNMSFGNRMFQLNPNRMAFDTEVEVYEVSTDNSKLSAGVHQFIVKQAGDSILITEYVQLINPTGMAVTSVEKDLKGRNKVITFHLPRGFKDLRMLNYFQSNAIVVTEDGFYDIMASPPGELQTAFSYSIDIAADVMEVTRKMSMPTAEFTVFSQLGAGNLQGLGEPAGEMTLADGSSAEYFNALSFEKGGEVKLQLSGFSGRNSLTGYLVIPAVILGIVGLVVVIRRRPGR